jgi:hypothetical protein
MLGLAALARWHVAIFLTLVWVFTQTLSHFTHLLLGYWAEARG